MSSAAIALNISNVAVGTTLTFTEAAVAGLTDNMAITLTNVTAAAPININTATANTVGFESVTIASTGSVANSVQLIANDTAGLAKATITGSADLTLDMSTNVTTTVTTIDASAATGKITVTGLGAAVHTLTGGTANDSFTLGANYIGGSTGATRDIINGGAGTDTLNTTLARVVAATTVQSNLTSIETLTISDAWADASNINVSLFSDVTTLNLAALTDGTSTATVKSGTTIVLAGSTANDSVTSFAVAGTSVSDTLTLNMASFDFAGTGTETFTGVETLNINTGSVVIDAATFAAALTLAPSAGRSVASIVVTGANAMTFTGVVTAADIDASALTGILTISGTGAQGMTIRGGTKADAITGSASADLIVGGEGADVITMGAGNDSVDLTETTVAIDKVVFAAVANTDDTAACLVKVGMNSISGFGTTDTLNIAGLGDGTTSATGLTTITAAAAQGAFADDTVYIINTAATAAALTTAGTAVITDFTNMTQVATFLGERFTVADATVEGVVVFNTTGTTYIYQISGEATAGAMTVLDIALVGTIAQTAALGTANLVYA